MSIKTMSGAQFSKRERTGVSSDILVRAGQILDNIQKEGFDGVIALTEKFDGIVLSKESVAVSTKGAAAKLTSLEKEAIDTAFERIKVVQEAIAKEALKEIRTPVGEGYVTLRPRSMERVGIYVPGGRAPLPSSLLMAGVTAKAAGVKEFIVCTPPQKNSPINPAILYIAEKLGIEKVYQIGGAQAIAAMAYGIESIFKKVDIICGPGNAYVAAAKQIALSRGLVAIDLIAGPSEVMILADESANPTYIAADMLAQAEHGETSPAVLLTRSERLGKVVEREVEKQLRELKDNRIATCAIQDYGALVIVNDNNEALKIVNQYGPEHLELFLSNIREMESIAKEVIAGAVFINTGEAFADYGMSGGNHILPTGGSARFYSGLSVYSFLVRTYEEFMTNDEQAQFSAPTTVFADIEKLPAHAKAARIRAKNGEKND